MIGEQDKPIAVTEIELAKVIGMSVHFLRKDRITKRLIPYYRIGDSIRYDLDRVRDALMKLEEGGTQKKTRGKISTGLVVDNKS